MEGAPEHRRGPDRRAWLVALAAVLLALYPPVVTWVSYGILSAFHFFAADTFYYLTIAKHDLPFPLYAFDGTHPTNGFHPLWQVFLNAAFANVGPLMTDQAAQIAFAHWAGVIAAAAAAGLLAFSAARLVGSPAVALFCVLPGFLYLPVAIVLPGVGNFWSFANGMESPFSLLAFAALLAVLLQTDFHARMETGRVLAVSVLATLMVLSRLDDVFILAALSLPVLLSGRPAREVLGRLALLNAIPAAAILAYLAVNYVHVGDALPVSGKYKSGLALFFNLRQAVNLVFPLATIFNQDWEIWGHLGGRMMFIVGPLAVSSVFLVRTWRSEAASRGARAMMWLSVYVILKALYNFCFVQLWHQGHWYFPVSFMIASLQVAMMLRRGDAGRERPPADATGFGRVRALMLAGGLLSGALLIAAMVYEARTPELSVARLKLLFAVKAAGVVGLALIPASRERVFAFLGGLAVGRRELLTALAVLFIANAVIAVKNGEVSNARMHHFWAKKAEVMADLRAIDPEMRILSFDDGVVGYVLDVPVMSAFGFALDHEAAVEARAGRLLDIAYARGFRYIGSVNSLPFFDAPPGADVTAEFIASGWFKPEHAAGWRFAVAHQDRDTELKLLRFRPEAER